MTISPAPIPNHFRDSEGNALKMATFDIGGWDMTTDLYAQIDIGDIDEYEIYMMQAWFTPDSEGGRNFISINSAVDGIVTPFYLVSDSNPNKVRIVLPALMTDPLYDSVLISRGTLYLWYRI